jgi:hypothetical protein
MIGPSVTALVGDYQTALANAASAVHLAMN